MYDGMPEDFQDLPDEVDIDRPNAARVYDYMLGGAHNFEVDRTFAEQVKAASGSSVRPSRVNRGFLRRTVEYLLAQGVTQFLDLGSGIPTVGNVHEIAQRTNPDARVVYVDIEPVAVAHAQYLLSDNKNAVMVHADLRCPDSVLHHPDTRRLIDFTQPVGLLMLAVLHFVPDTENPAGIVTRYRSALPAGSYLALSHLTDEGSADLARAAAWFNRTATPMILRSKADVTAMMTGTDLVDPGVVWAAAWHPDGSDVSLGSPAESGIYAAVGQIPAT